MHIPSLLGLVMPLMLWGGGGVRRFTPFLCWPKNVIAWILSLYFLAFEDLGIYTIKLQTIFLPLPTTIITEASIPFMGGWLYCVIGRPTIN